MKLLLIQAVRWFVEVIQLAMILRAVMSWFVRDLNTGIGKLYSILTQITEPMVAPIRNIINRYGGTGGIDWSVLIAFLFVQFIGNVIIRLIYYIF